jgi:hypothetical protein
VEHLVHALHGRAHRAGTPDVTTGELDGSVPERRREARPAKQAAHGRAVGQQPLHEVASDEAVSTGHERTHLREDIGVPRSRPPGID